MPGVAQLWLTQKEIEALLLAGPLKGTTVSPSVWENLEPKLTEALDALGCSVNGCDPYTPATVCKHTGPFEVGTISCRRIAGHKGPHRSGNVSW